MDVKSRVYEIITSPEEPSTASKIFDISIIALIVINVVTVIIDTFKIPPWFTSTLWYIEVVSTIIFFY